MLKDTTIIYGEEKTFCERGILQPTAIAYLSIKHATQQALKTSFYLLSPLVSVRRVKFGSLDYYVVALYRNISPVHSIVYRENLSNFTNIGAVFLHVEIFHDYGYFPRPWKFSTIV